MLQMTNLSKIAVSLKGGVEIASNYPRIQQFLSDYVLNFTALGPFVAAPVAPKGAVCGRT